MCVSVELELLFYIPILMVMNKVVELRGERITFMSLNMAHPPTHKTK